jgi:hypothetical protein
LVIGWLERDLVAVFGQRDGFVGVIHTAFQAHLDCVIAPGEGSIIGVDSLFPVDDFRMVV